MDYVKVKIPDQAAMRKARQKWDRIAKPLHSLGVFEEIIVQLAGIYGSSEFDLQKKAVIVYCADNGVVSEGVTQSDSSVTLSVAESMADGRANINIIAKSVGADVYVADVGMIADSGNKNIITKKAANGTGNITAGAAMSAEQCRFAIKTGADMVERLSAEGISIIATGEMGIGNTTTSSAMASVLLGRALAELTGRGAGLSDEGLERKISAIRRAIEINKPNPQNAFEVLQKLGGFDIAAMAGTFIGGMLYGTPIVIDGFISAVAALAAVRMIPECSPYILASHVSKEPAALYVLDALGKKAVIHADMCLGEGTGAAMLFPLLDAAYAEYVSAHTFGDIKIEPYMPQK